MRKKCNGINLINNYVKMIVLKVETFQPHGEVGMNAALTCPPDNPDTINHYFARQSGTAGREPRDVMATTNKSSSNPKRKILCAASAWILRTSPTGDQDLHERPKYACETTASTVETSSLRSERFRCCVRGLRQIELFPGKLSLV
jgi:hypothetical protein